MSRAPESRPVPEPPRAIARGLPPWQALALPCAFVAALGVLALLIVRQQPALLSAFAGAGGALLAWSAALAFAARRARRTFTLEFTPRPQHWLQACAQGSVLLYWGWHARIVYAFLPFILAQLIFAYAVDSLVAWSRRDTYTLGFGPFPVVFSINLFLWFRPQWFFLQFAMIAVGFLAKELIRWNKEGRSAHIFNPSSFPLAVFSLALIITASSNITLGYLIANTQFDTPHIYLAIFLAALPGQFLFGVAAMTMPAVVTLYAVSLLYFKATGTYLFYDANIPVPVFLGMHLLLPDPSTSPRSELGRISFGMLYGLGTAACYVGLTALGIPTFYDKLLPVPLMNLLVRFIDRGAVSKAFAGLDPRRLGRALTPRGRNAAYASIWVGVFAAMSAVKAVGDTHPGQYLPFWQKACGAGNVRACNYAANLTLIYCNNGSGWACNEIGILRRQLGQAVGQAFSRGCELGFTPACDNANRAATDPRPLAHAPPLLADLPIVLRGTKPPIREREPAKLYALACAQGWPGMCDSQATEKLP